MVVEIALIVLLSLVILLFGGAIVAGIFISDKMLTLADKCVQIVEKEAREKRDAMRRHEERVVQLEEAQIQAYQEFEKRQKASSSKVIINGQELNPDDYELDMGFSLERRGRHV